MTTLRHDPATPAPAFTGSGLRRQLAAAVRVLLALTLLLGVAYPAAIWAVSRLPGLHGPAEGTPTLIGIDPVPRNPAADPWFHTRPSASAPDDAVAGLGPADAATSGGSNLGPSSAELEQAVAARRAAVAARDGVDPASIPPDALTASASGLDPHISPEYAAQQVPRVARITGLPPDRVRALVADATDGPTLGFLGEPRVNVVELDTAVAAATGAG